MRFVDEARIKIKAGDGGPGIVAWRREKFVPMGGPAGGDGGKGGDIIFIANEGLSSLLDLKHQTLIAAPDGFRGENKNKTGRCGNDKVVYVPVGTQLLDANDPHAVPYDFITHNQTLVVCRGGDGGFGNAHFKTQSTNAPSRSTPGFPGEERELILTLKLMADVGLLGLPNAGKSTLLTRLSNARPKVADYPFTTIKPMVGVCELDLSRTMVVADIPGLIEGASEGQGLGFRFLRHLERVRILCHLIDGSSEEDLHARFSIINRELELYSPELAQVPQVVVINKMDAVSLEQKQAIDEFVATLLIQGITCYQISAVSGDGLVVLKEALYKAVTKVFGYKDPASVSFDPTLHLY